MVESLQNNSKQFQYYTETDKEPVTPKYHEDHIKNNGSQTSRSTVTPRGDVRTSYLTKRGAGRRASVPTTATTTSTAIKKPKPLTNASLKSPGRKSVVRRKEDDPAQQDSCDEGMFCDEGIDVIVTDDIY